MINASVPAFLAARHGSRTRLHAALYDSRLSILDYLYKSLPNDSAVKDVLLGTSASYNHGMPCMRECRRGGLATTHRIQLPGNVEHRLDDLILFLKGTASSSHSMGHG